MTRKEPLSPPPEALAQALGRPYRPGRQRRQWLLGAVFVAATASLFLLLMPSRPAPGASEPAGATRAVLYQNLQAAPREGAVPEPESIPP